jgi:glycosyltransferase involved in cell wall biosynthesis
MFAATEQSLPQYNHSQKKVVTGHGVDVAYWSQVQQGTDETQLLMVHRLSRSKRVELGIEALALLPEAYTLTIYGRPIDAAYFAELQALVSKRGLGSRVTFKGPLPMPELRAVYPHYRLFLNMASETIDKTMLEAMCNGLYPVTTARNTEAIGLTAAPTDDTPKAIADFILSRGFAQYTSEQLRTLVADKHSLSALVTKMSKYIKNGN